MLSPSSDLVRTLIPERLQVFIVHTAPAELTLFLNVYHMRAGEDVDARKEHDKTFIQLLDGYTAAFRAQAAALGCAARIVLVGDMNSTRGFHDTAKNIIGGRAVKPLWNKHPDGWEPGKTIDENHGCYQRHFMSYFEDLFDFHDHGAGLGIGGLTYFFNGEPKMRIDYALTSGCAVNAVFNFAVQFDDKAIQVERQRDRALIVLPFPSDHAAISFELSCNAAAEASARIAASQAATSATAASTASRRAVRRQRNEGFSDADQ
jgi:hypothetical protein